MAFAAIRQTRNINMIVGDQVAALAGLVCGSLPAHIENFVMRPDELLWVAVAFQAPFHVERAGFPRQRHFIDRAVARGAADALGDVNAMIKENEVGEFVDSVPTQRDVVSQTVTDRRQQRSACK